MFGSAFYGDVLITPAISVLSAVEGLGVATTSRSTWCRSPSVSRLPCLASALWHRTCCWCPFGPITCVRFIAIGVLGPQGHHRNAGGATGNQPNPMYGQFCIEYPGKMFVLLVSCPSRSPGAGGAVRRHGAFARGTYVWSGLSARSSTSMLKLLRTGGTLCCATPPRSRTRFYRLALTHRCWRWWCWPPPPPRLQSRGNNHLRRQVSHHASRRRGVGYLPRIDASSRHRTASGADLRRRCGTGSCWIGGCCWCSSSVHPAQLAAVMASPCRATRDHHVDFWWQPAVLHTAGRRQPSAAAGAPALVFLPFESGFPGIQSSGKVAEWWLVPAAVWRRQAFLLPGDVIRGRPGGTTNAAPCDLPGTHRQYRSRRRRGRRAPPLYLASNRNRRPACCFATSGH